MKVDWYIVDYLKTPVHAESPELYTVLAFLNAIGLKQFQINYLSATSVRILTRGRQT